MFDETIRALKELAEKKMQAGIPMDSEGYLDRECPSEACEFQFKVLGDDWKDKVIDEHVTCPFCGHVADANKWFTQDQVNTLEEAAAAQLSSVIGGALKRDAETWNRRQPR